jgi:hypothetical protein
MPPDVATPRSPVTPSKSALVAYPPQNVIRLALSRVVSRIRTRLMTSPPSQVARRATLCAPPRIAIGMPMLSAWSTARRTSSTPWQTATAAGLSIAPLKIMRASS